MIDACLAITFGNAGAIHVLSGLRVHHVVISQRALGEVTRPPAKGAVQRVVEASQLQVVAIDLEIPAEQDALVRFDSSTRFRGRGDAEVLALAVARGWVVGSDEVAIQRAAEAELGRLRFAGSLDFLRWAVVESRITVPDAIALIRVLDVGETLLRRIQVAGESPEAVLGS